MGPLPEVGPAAWGSVAGVHWREAVGSLSSNRPTTRPGCRSTSELRRHLCVPESRPSGDAGLTSDDLRWWAGDHRVVAKALAAPAQRQLPHPGLDRLRQRARIRRRRRSADRQGGLLCSQFLLARKFDTSRWRPAVAALSQLLRPGRQPSRVSTPRRWWRKPTRRPPPRWPRSACKPRTSRAASPIATPSLYPVLVLAGSNAVWQEAASALSNLAAYVEARRQTVAPPARPAFLAAAQPVLFPD